MARVDRRRRRQVAFYGSTPGVPGRAGAPRLGGPGRRSSTASKQGEWDDMARLIDDEWSTPSRRRRARRGARPSWSPAPAASRSASRSTTRPVPQTDRWGPALAHLQERGFRMSMSQDGRVHRGARAVPQDRARRSSSGRSTPTSTSGRRGGIFPAHELFPKLGDAGLLGLEYDPAYGGQGADHSSPSIFGEELGRARLRRASPMAISVQTDMATPVAAPLRQPRS